MKTLALFAMIGAAAPQQTPPAADEPKTVIVTAKRLDVTEKALRDCLARGCPPDQEIDAALAHAENLFVDGDYIKARRTLMTTIGHVDKRSKEYPEAVGDIWRAQARIAQHLGEKDQTRISQFESLSALRKGVPSGDARVLAQRLSVADTLARQGRTDLAKNTYNDVAKDARAAHLPNAEGTALLRVALLEAAFYELQPEAFGVGLDRAVKALTDRDDPALAVYQDAARLLRDRLKIKPGDTAAVDRLIAQYAPATTTRPILIYQPTQFDGEDSNPRPRTIDGRAVSNRTDTGFDGQWADVTFRILPNGHVEDVDVAREGATFDREWIEPTLKAIAGRRYAPLTLPAGKTGLRQVERYTLTAYYEAPTGTRVRSRAFPRIEMLDLSPVSTASAGPAPSIPGSQGPNFR